MVNARPCEKARLAFFFGSLRNFDFFTCETETSKCFKCELETFPRYSSSKSKKWYFAAFLALKKIDSTRQVCEKQTLYATYIM